ncbi:hypothetical protein HPG69_018082, partial [Diceros bicornis minor]
IAFSRDEPWGTLRRFTLTALRDLGLGRRSLGDWIQEEVGCLEEELEKSHGTLFDPTFLIHCSISNIICSVVFGHRFHCQDEDFKTFLGLLAENLKRVDTFWVQLFEVFKKRKAFVAPVVREHEISLDTAQPRDFINAFLIGMQQDGDNQHHPQIWAPDPPEVPQDTELIQQEIDRLVGPKRRPCLGDRAWMLYTDAILHEILRFAAIIPLAMPHAVTQDTQFWGHHIPKGTTVFPLFHSVLHNSDQFQDPASFQPERFLDANRAFRKCPAFLPFSAGQYPCSCPGEGLLCGSREDAFSLCTSFFSISKWLSDCWFGGQMLQARLR